MSVSTIVFDLGGVIVPLNRTRCEASFQALNPAAFKDSYHRKWEEGFFDKYEIGGMSSEEFAGSLAGLLKTSPELIVDAWNSMFEPIPVEHLRLLKELSKRYTLYLLSNTNAIHMDWILAHLDDLGFPEFDGAFKRLFLSYELHCRKPEREIYQKVQQIMHLETSEFVFIDDTLENTAHAESCGWKVIHHEFNAPMENLKDALSAV